MQKIKLMKMWFLKGKVEENTDWPYVLGFLATLQKKLSDPVEFSQPSFRLHLPSRSLCPVELIFANIIFFDCLFKSTFKSELHLVPVITLA